jgi:predicted aspartyl protease
MRRCPPNGWRSQKRCYGHSLVARSRPIKKTVVLSGNKPRSVKVTAHVDTGSYRCVVCRSDAEKIGAAPVGIESTLLILGKHVDGEIMLVHFHLPSGDCAAVVEAFVPKERKIAVPTIVGQSFLEVVGATVSFEKGRPVLCPSRTRSRRSRRRGA